MNKLAILLSTYNSSKFLEQQLYSIINQTYKDWKLYIRDDGSTDKTIDIISNFVEKDSRIEFFSDNLGNLGACKSFFQLLNNIKAKYYMFCDHDDVWLSEKVELSLSGMRKQERKNFSTPILIHTDMCIVDENLKLISSSFWNNLKVNPKYCKFHNLAVGNFVNGCTMLLNERAKNVSLKGCDNASMHDVWIALRVASENGILYPICEKTVLYRQHKSNVIGAKHLSIINSLKNFLSFKAFYARNIKQFRMVNKAGKISFSSYWYHKLHSIVRKFFVLL